MKTKTLLTIIAGAFIAIPSPPSGLKVSGKLFRQIIKQIQPTLQNGGGSYHA